MFSPLLFVNRGRSFPKVTETSLTNNVGDEDKVLKRNPEWEQLNKYDFFRRTAIFYIRDRRLLRAYFVSMLHMYKNTNQSYSLYLTLGQYSLHLPHVHMKLHWHFHKQSIVASLNWHDLNLVKALNAKFSLNLTEQVLRQNKHLSLSIRDEVTNLTTHHALYVQIKRQQSRRKSGSMLCTYCYFYGDSNSRQNFLQVKLSFSQKSFTKYLRGEESSYTPPFQIILLGFNRVFIHIFMRPRTFRALSRLSISVKAWNF